MQVKISSIKPFWIYQLNRPSKDCWTEWVNNNCREVELNINYINNRTIEVVHAETVEYLILPNNKKYIYKQEQVLTNNKRVQVLELDLITTYVIDIMQTMLNDSVEVISKQNHLMKLNNIQYDNNELNDYNFSSYQFQKFSFNLNENDYWEGKKLKIKNDDDLINANFYYVFSDGPNGKPLMLPVLSKSKNITIQTSQLHPVGNELDEIMFLPNYYTNQTTITLAGTKGCDVYNGTANRLMRNMNSGDSSKYGYNAGIRKSDSSYYDSASLDELIKNYIQNNKYIKYEMLYNNGGNFSIYDWNNMPNAHQSTLLNNGVVTGVEVNWNENLSNINRNVQYKYYDILDNVLPSHIQTHYWTEYNAANPVGDRYYIGRNFNGQQFETFKIGTASYTGSTIGVINYASFGKIKIYDTNQTIWSDDTIVNNSNGSLKALTKTQEYANKFMGVFLAPNILNFKNIEVVDVNGNKYLTIDYNENGVRLNDESLFSIELANTANAFNSYQSLSKLKINYYNNVLNLPLNCFINDYTDKLEFKLSGEVVFAGGFNLLTKFNLLPFNNGVISFGAQLPFFIDEYNNYVKSQINTLSTGYQIQKSNNIINTIQYGAGSFLSTLLRPSGIVENMFSLGTNIINNMRSTNNYKKQILANLNDKNNVLGNKMLTSYTDDAKFNFITYGEQCEFFEISIPSFDMIKNFNNKIKLNGEVTYFYGDINNIWSIENNKNNFRFINLDVEHLKNNYLYLFKNIENNFIKEVEELLENGRYYDEWK